MNNSAQLQSTPGVRHNRETEWWTHHSFWFDLPLLTGALIPRNLVFRHNAQLSSLPQASPRDQGSHEQGAGEKAGCKVVQPRNPTPQQVFRKLSNEASTLMEIIPHIKSILKEPNQHCVVFWLVHSPVWRAGHELCAMNTFSVNGVAWG